MRRGAVLIGCALATGCGQTSNMEERRTESLATMDVAEPPAPAPPGIVPPSPTAATPPSAAPSPIAIGVPQVAYSYKYAFRLPGDRIAAAQEAHIALCDRLGPARCQVLARATRTGEGEEATGSLKLRVASAEARRFGAAMAAAVAKAGGRALDSSIDAEDVSKDLVDAEARIRQRSILVERLTDILRTRQGKVAELVEAERSVAAAQEEIDAARGWLAELRNRVAMSTVQVDYQAVAAAVESPRTGLAEAAARSWSGFVAGLGAIATLLLLLLPWALLAGSGALLWRWARPRLPWPQRTGPEAPATP